MLHERLTDADVELAQLNLLGRYLARQAQAKYPKGTRRKTDGAGSVARFDHRGQRLDRRWGRLTVPG